MANCKFLRQKKQVKINGEWVDTRSYRYIPYCDGGTPSVTVINGRPNTSFTIHYYNSNGSIKGKSVQMDDNGNAYVEFESGDIINSIDYIYESTPYEVGFRACKIYGIDTPRSQLKLTISCSTLARGGDFSSFEGTSLTFKDVDISLREGNLHYLFGNCPYLTSLDVSNFITSNATDMSDMFNCNLSLKNLDVSSFNTSNVTSMNGMFGSCESLTSLDLSNFITSKVTNMNGMFSDCIKLASLNLSNFNTSNVTDMGSMFAMCLGLASLNVSSFNTSKVTNMENMFYY